MGRPEPEGPSQNGGYDGSPVPLNNQLSRRFGCSWRGVDLFTSPVSPSQRRGDAIPAKPDATGRRVHDDMAAFGLLLRGVMRS